MIESKAQTLQAQILKTAFKKMMSNVQQTKLSILAKVFEGAELLRNNTTLVTSHTDEENKRAAEVDMSDVPRRT